MLSLVLFSARTGRARTLVGMQQLAFCVYDMCILPAYREHLTLYFNSLIAIQLMISAVSPSRGAWYLHGAAFITAHTMPVAYFILLDYTGDGPHARLSLQQYLRGFEVVDITQWAGVGRGVGMAVEVSAVLHALPLLMVHLDLYAHRETLAVAHKGSTWRSHLWSFLSSFILPLIYQFYATVRYGSPEAAASTLYRLPMAKTVDFMLVTGAMNLIVGVLSYAYVHFTLSRHEIQRRKGQ